MGDFWIRPDEWDEDRSEFGVPSRELDSQCGEDKVEVSPVFEVSGTEEGGTETSIRKQPLCDRLCDRALPCPSEPIQPVDRGLFKVAGPEFDLVQNCSAGALETRIATCVSVLSLFCISEAVENGRISYKRGILQEAVVGSVKAKGNLPGSCRERLFVWSDINVDTHHQSESFVIGHRLLYPLLPC